MKLKPQAEQILRLLQAHAGEWVGLPEIWKLEPHVLQYGARILELRRAGHDIRNRKEKVNGVTFSWYRLVKEFADRELVETRSLEDIPVECEQCTAQRKIA